MDDYFSITFFDRVTTIGSKILQVYGGLPASSETNKYLKLVEEVYKTLAQIHQNLIDVTINVASLTTNNPQRDNDLRSSYFLELDKYPTITFKSTRIERTGTDTFDLTGDLTVKGIAKPVTFKVKRYGEINDPRMGHRIAYSAEGEINRKDFGMEFDMLADNRLVVSHEIKIFVEAYTARGVRGSAKIWQSRAAARSPGLLALDPAW